MNLGIEKLLKKTVLMKQFLENVYQGINHLFTDTHKYCSTAKLNTA